MSISNNKLSTNKKKRVKDELWRAGVTQYGLLKGESRHLHNIVHDDETINGVVYGRTDNGSAMIVATNKRVLYLDHRILFNKSEVITYEVVSGVSVNEQSGYAGVVLHTRIRDFRLRFVNLKCARKFAKYIDARRIISDPEVLKVDDLPKPDFRLHDLDQAEYSSKARLFLISNYIGVLSTQTSNNTVQGSVVFYTVDNNNLIYIASKSKTSKSYNITQNPSVALTIFNLENVQTLQIEGYAFIEKDPIITRKIFDRVLKPRKIDGKEILSPLSQIPAGEYEVIVIKTTHYKYANYNK